MREKRNNTMLRLGIGFSFALLIILATPLIFSQDVYAVAQETCPDTGDWVKVDGINAQSYNYVAPEGKQIVEVCYKAGTTVKYETIDPPQPSVTVTTDVPNPNENAFQDISHASFRLAEEVKQEEQPFVRITYICTADIAGIVEGYGLDVQTGDHIWRVRHESGPATNFSTNFLSDVQGFINVGETLYFVTPQSANGVKVITSPLANLYEGTASVSGAVCDVPEEKSDPEELTLMGECLGDGNIEWKVTNPNDFAVQFSWETNDSQSGDADVPANSFVTFKTASTGNMVSLSYSLDNEQISTDKTIEVCDDPEEEKDPEELNLMGECLGDGSIEWKVTNPNDFAIQFSWKTNDDQSGDSEVPANSFVTFTTTSTGSMIYLSYSLAEEPMSIEQSVVVCDDPEEEPKEEPKESVDPQPDMPAGGLAPSLLASITPFVFGISGFSGLAALVIKSKNKKIK